MGTEEAHGYLLGTYARDKDAAVAALLLAELADEARAAGKSLHEVLDDCFWRYGCHQERTLAKVMPGADGMQQMQAMMSGLRQQPPTTVAGTVIVEVHDYLRHTVCQPADAHSTRPMTGVDAEVPASNLLVFHGDQGRVRAAIRPSGTEPKIKFYLFARETADESQDVTAAKQRLNLLLDQLERDLLTHADKVANLAK